jgi:ferritin-like metal-binding protein YciE
MSLNTLHDLFVDEIRDLYSAENQLVQALPKMVKSATSSTLQQAFQAHFEQTRHHVERLEEIFSELDTSPKGKKCVAMEGLIKEGSELMKEHTRPEVLDAGLIGAAQRVEHYEIAAYGTARAHAEQLGYSIAASWLQQTLNEEKEANEKLTQIAETSANEMAISPA